MSLCHGPGCRREQKVPYWCSEACQERWDARWGKRLPSGPDGPVGVSVAIDGAVLVHRDVANIEEGLVVARQAIEGHFAAKQQRQQSGWLSRVLGRMFGREEQT